MHTTQAFEGVGRGEGMAPMLKRVIAHDSFVIVEGSEASCNLQLWLDPPFLIKSMLGAV